MKISQISIAILLAMSNLYATKICVRTGFNFPRAAGGSNGGPGSYTWWNEDGGGKAILKGDHACGDSSHSSGNPAANGGGYCHCRRMELDGIASIGPWVLRNNYGSSASCLNECAEDCSNTFSSDLNFQSLILAPLRTSLN